MKKTNESRESVHPVPEGFHTVTPFIMVHDAANFIEFLKDAFNGKAMFVSKGDDESIIHATVKIGDSMIMVADSMQTMQPQTAMIFIYVKNVDSMYRQAVAAKGTPVQEPKNEFYGDRAGAVKDAWGNTWWIATHVQDISDSELKKRAKEEFKKKNEHAEV